MALKYSSRQLSTLVNIIHKRRVSQFKVQVYIWQWYIGELPNPLINYFWHRINTTREWFGCGVDSVYASFGNPHDRGSNTGKKELCSPYYSSQQGRNAQDQHDVTRHAARFVDGALVKKQCDYTFTDEAILARPLSAAGAPTSLYRIASATPSIVELSMLRCLRAPFTLNLSRCSSATTSLLEHKHRSAASDKR